jgi:putative acetyltransferase
MRTIVIRPIQKKDNIQIATVIRQVLIDLNVPKVGTAYADPQLDCMFETYSKSKSIYYVVASQDMILGGAGISHLENEAATICELQKMYFLPEARGLGLGFQMIQKCLQSAHDFGYQKCYLETMPYMEAAQQLYKKVGFEYICAPMGNTGHVSCPVWMLKDL